MEVLSERGERLVAMRLLLPQLSGFSFEDFRLGCKSLVLMLENGLRLKSVSFGYGTFLFLGTTLIKIAREIQIITAT